jgi:hypothetical protein
MVVNMFDRKKRHEAHMKRLEKKRYRKRARRTPKQDKRTKVYASLGLAAIGAPIVAYVGKTLYMNISKSSSLEDVLSSVIVGSVLTAMTAAFGVVYYRIVKTLRDDIDKDIIKKESLEKALRSYDRDKIHSILEKDRCLREYAEYHFPDELKAYENPQRELPFQE